MTLNAAAARRQRIDEEARSRPESRPWLRLLQRALDAADRPEWRELEPRLPSARAPDAPLLHDAFVAVDRRAARRWVRGLLEAAAASPAGAEGAALSGLRGRALDAIELLAAAAAEDDDALSALAAREDVDPAALVAVGRLASIPLLHGCAAALHDRHPPGWARGACPVCGGVPVLAELRGLERRRVLRCSRCAAGWELPVLVCPFCDERDHDRQFSFAAEGEEQRRRVDACRSCDGYIKTLTTLAPLASWTVPLEDLGTLELDLVAGDRGLRRPHGSAFPAAVRVVVAEGVLGRFGGGWA